MVEALRYGAWFVLLRSLAPPSPAWFKRTYLGLVLALAGYAVFGWIGDYIGLYAFPLAGMLETFGLLLAFGGLVATEQTMRNALAENSTHVRLCAIGVGGQLAFDLFLFSQAQLLGAVDPGAWVLRGVVAALLLIPFALGVLRMPVAEPRVFVSRHVVFYTSAFVAVGAYLCLMALGGYYVREQGGGWGNALQVVFLCGAVAMLALLLLVGIAVAAAARFHLHAFLSQQVRLPHRVAALRPDAVGRATRPDVRRTAVRAVAQIFGSPGGLLFCRDEDGSDRYTLRATWPESLRRRRSNADAISDQDALPRFLRERQWVIDLREYRSDAGSVRQPRAAALARSRAAHGASSRRCCVGNRAARVSWCCALRPNRSR